MRAAFASLVFFMGWSTTLTAPSQTENERPAERINPNRNEASAGNLKDGVLTLRLEVREGEWRPDRENDPAITVYAFGEEGKPLQIPGPLVRVPEGTEIRATIRSRVSQRLYVRGLSSRGSAVSAADTLQIEPGAVREVSFQAGAPGTYFYSATTVPPRPNFQQPAIGSQLYGGFIVDTRGSARMKERIFVLSFWADSAALLLDGTPRTFRFAINGKAWPLTERIQHSVGDSIRWRVINASAAVHPMHLHGFYYRVDSRGNESLDSIYPRTAAPHMVVTERLAPGRTMTMTWVPERPGNWLFHCHDNVHIVPNPPLPGATIAKAADPHANHALEMMGGLVMGVEVRARGNQTATPSNSPRRELRLVARTAEGGSAAEPSYGFVLQEGANPVNTTPRLPGPSIVLKRGEPVRIMVVNELPEQTAVHWHGIELESYYDGVPGFAGSSARLAPAIQPRDSFEVRFTPPRSGTFIYHTHVDEVRQQRAGLFGALIVVDPDKPFDPTTDIPVLISTPRNVVDNAVVLVNGTATPAPLEMRAGTPYRIRIINIHTFRPSMRAELKQGTGLLTWRAVAKDGADLPPERSTVRPAAQQLGNGETYDFEFRPTAAGELKLEVLTGAGVLLTTLPIIVR